VCQTLDGDVGELKRGAWSRSTAERNINPVAERLSRPSATTSVDDEYTDALTETIPENRPYSRLVHLETNRVAVSVKAVARS